MCSRGCAHSSWSRCFVPTSWSRPSRSTRSTLRQPSSRSWPCSTARAGRARCCKPANRTAANVLHHGSFAAARKPQAPPMLMSAGQTGVSASKMGYVDCMTKPRQDAAVQQNLPEAGEMAIGEFGGAPAALGPSGPTYAAPAYWFYEMSQAALNPSRAFADAARLFYRNPANPLSYTSFGKSMAAGLELFERSTRRYGKPEWNITSAVVARMEAENDPYVPHSMVLMGGPIDTRENPTEVNKLAEARGTDWFRSNVITKVPFPNPGFMRDVYPGFLQLHGFVSMNLDRHIEAHRKLFQHLVKSDGDSAQKHREFYDEYLAVMDLAAEYYLQTVETVFVRHALPKGEMMHHGVRIDPAQIRRVALMTVEGENDDISGVGQTEAAHKLCVNIPAERKAHWLQPAVGHYGVFNGSRFRSEIVPRISDFVLSNNGGSVRSSIARAIKSRLAVVASNSGSELQPSATRISAAE